LSDITELNLGHNKIGDRGAASLARALSHAQCKLAILHLSCCELGDAGVSCLAAALQTNTALRVLDLNHNTDISSSGASMLAQVLNKAQPPFAQIHVLSAVNTNIGVSGAVSLARTVALGRLRTLWLSGAHIEDDGVEAIASALLRPGAVLIELGLEDCQIGDRGACALARALTCVSSACESPSISTSSSSSSATSASIASSSSSASASSSWLDSESDGSASTSVALLHDQHAKDSLLDQKDDPIESSSASAGSRPAVAHTPTLRVLLLDDNREITDVGAIALAAALATNRSLQQFSLAGCAIADAGAEAMAAAMVTATLPSAAAPANDTSSSTNGGLEISLDNCTLVGAIGARAVSAALRSCGQGGRLVKYSGPGAATSSRASTGKRPLGASGEYEFDVELDEQ
jgi:hypothetical protein